MSLNLRWAEKRAHYVYLAIALPTAAVSLPAAPLAIVFVTAIFYLIVNMVEWRFLNQVKPEAKGKLGGARFLHRVCNCSLAIMALVFVLLGLAIKFGPLQSEALVERAMDVPEIRASKNLISLSTTVPDTRDHGAHALVGRFYEEQVHLLRLSILVGHVLDFILDRALQLGETLLLFVLVMLVAMGYIHSCEE